ncbi:MAG: hypothetical protein NC081_02110 [Roseburia sp.]|nr:hypothetical protein [Roseburia sp.]
MKNNKIILPINENPYLKSYTHNTYISSILSSELIGGTTVARYRVINKDITWNIINDECDTQIEEVVTVSTSMRKENGYSVLYTQCDEDDALIVKVDFRRKACAWEQFCLILDDEISQESFDKDRCLVKFGCPSGQKLNIKRKEEFVSTISTKRILDSEYYLKLERKKLDIKLSYSCNGKKWFCVYSDSLPAKYKIAPLSMGVLVEIRNHYMNWMASNNIQLCMKRPRAEELMIDYYMGPTKHYKTYIASHYLDFMYEYFDYTKLSGRKVMDIIHSRLNDNFYIITELNHYYLPKTTHYLKQQFYHEVMIYGIDKKKGVCFVMGYGDQSVVFTYELGIKELWKALNPAGVMLVIARVDVNYRDFLMNSEVIKKRLKDYLSGYNNEKDTMDIFPPQGIEKFGLDIFRHLVENNDDLYIFCTDIRLPFVLYEHKKIMLDRVKYLVNNMENLQQIDEKIIKLLKENVKIAEIIKNSTLMNSVCGNKKTTMKKIREYLMLLIKNEEEAYDLLCKAL